MSNKLKISNQEWIVKTRSEVQALPVKALNCITHDSVENRLGLLRELSSPKRPSLKRAIVKAARSEQGESDRLFKVLALLDEYYEPRKVEAANEEVVPYLAHFKHEGIVYHLPKPNGNDMTLEEWTIAVSSFENYLKTDDINLLLRVVATISRPLRSRWERAQRDYDGYPRIPFNEETIPDAEEELADIEPGIAYACVDFLSCMNQLLELRYPLLFSGAVSDGPNWGWFGTIISLAGDTIERMDSVKKMNLHLACVYMTKKRMEQQAYERQLEDIKKGRK